MTGTGLKQSHNNSDDAEILVSDLSVAEPSEAMADLPMRDKWYKMPYSVAGAEGVLLRSFPEAPAQRVRIRFQAQGHYAVHVGIHYSMIERDDVAMRFGAVAEFGCLRIRLAGDCTFAVVLPEVQGVKGESDPNRQIRQNAITEVFWRYAHFTGDSYVEIEPNLNDKEPCPLNPASPAWLRLVPIGTDRQRLVRQLKPNAATRRITCFTSMVDAQDFEPVAETADFDRCYLDGMRLDTCMFPTPVGSVYGSIEHECGNYSVESSRKLKQRIDAGWDPMADFIKVGQKHDIAIYPAMRIALHRDPPQHLPLAQPNRVYENRGYWVRDRSGHAYPHAALAVPDVRKLIVDMFADVLERYDVAGICIIGIRGWPWVGYEPASARLFAEHCDQPINELPETDDRFIEHRCRVFTMLMRELREMVDALSAKRRRRFRIALDTMNCIDNARFHGQDIVKWAQDGLIDELTLNACHCRTRPEPQSNPTVKLTQQVRQAIGQESFSVRPHLWPRFMSPGRYMDRAQEFWEAGVEGLALWDLFHRTSRLSEWAVQRHLGHVDCYHQLRRECGEYWRSVPIRQMDGICMMNADYSANSSG